MTAALTPLIDRARLVVTVGTGGVGKTTVAAALALAAARRGRRAIVVTIDPARALARALGLERLDGDDEAVPAAALAAAGVTVEAPLAAAMLDARRAWDAFVRRSARAPADAEALLGNRIYQALASSFAGATEYMALETLCRLDEAGRHELIVIDTPPAADAVEFVSAPERIAPLVERGVVAALARPAGVAGALARFVARRLEGVAGGRTIAELSAFFAALEAVVDAAAARAARARALLRAPGAAFVLVARPRDQVLAQTGALAASLGAVAAPIAALVLNRMRVAPPEVDAETALIAIADPAIRAWARAAWQDARAAAQIEATALARAAAAAPGATAVVAVPELAPAAHPLAQLARIADALIGAAAPRHGAIIA